MSTGINNRGNLLSSLIIAFGIVCSCASAREGDGQYWTGQSNVVATVSAYEFMSHLPSGENVPYYSTNVVSRCTNSYAILFYVVAPKKYAGKYFRLQENEPMPFGSVFPPPVHRLGELYYFRFAEVSDKSFSDIAYWFGLTPDDLFSFPTGEAGRLSVGKTTSNIYYHSTQDATQALHDLNKERICLEKQMGVLSNQIEKARSDGVDVRNDRQYRKMRGQYLDLKNGSLPSNGYRQKEVRMQIEKLKELEQTKPPTATER